MLEVGGHQVLTEALNLAVLIRAVLYDLHSNHRALPPPCAPYPNPQAPALPPS